MLGPVFGCRYVCVSKGCRVCSVYWTKKQKRVKTNRREDDTEEENEIVRIGASDRVQSCISHGLVPEYNVEKFLRI